MKHLLSILLTAILCATASAQTIKTLGFNTTNGQVVANTGTNVLTFTNDVNFGADMTISGQVIAGTGVSFSFEDADFAYGATVVRQNLGFSTNLNTLWTATNQDQARSALGLGNGSEPDFFLSMTFVEDTNSFTVSAVAAVNRTNLGLPLAALTNTSNVTVMRALAGSTNTNQPFTGTIYYNDPENTNAGTAAEFVNGILIRVYEGP